MTSADEDLKARLGELVKDAAKLLGHAQEADRHRSAGNLTAVAEVVGLMHYPLGQVADEVGGIMQVLAAQGVSPGSD